MASMFQGCTQLVEISFNPYINTKNLETVGAMFSDCISLKSIDLSSFNTQNVNTMYQMFFNCTSLTSINLSNFNTQKVNDMDRMFFLCFEISF